ncbi:hypothetical protein A2cp1_0946 [Anaeromyxobacter dehalogenans 2CP-1]|uniref:Uncharacterized protein n=1 Tax=Anaeromyxobacter dehalogenans (strain ATCC BAA-258 / DSM 21875 / 2CP-1) TaxID=455488 RepID=B8JEH1_ANAD2|nr:hypothetical protein A2cp1_0946 [Anaeromyxobacter dehalogenans 2CP-1]
MEWLSNVLLVGAAVGIAAVATQHLVLWRHVRQAPRVPLGTPGVSVLKPLCGLEDGLAGGPQRHAPEHVVLGEHVLHRLEAAQREEVGSPQRHRLAHLRRTPWGATASSST